MRKEKKMIYIFTQVFRNYYDGCCIIQAASKKEAMYYATCEHKAEVLEEFEKSACIEVPSLDTETKVIYYTYGGG